MSAALRYEWMRIRTIRSTWWLTLLTVAFGTAIAFVVSWGISDTFNFAADAPSPEEQLLLGPLVVGHFSGEGAPFFPPYILAMVGVFAWGHEYRHGMIRATLTALPSRVAAWVAKYVVVTAWVAAVTVLTLLLSGLMGWLWLRDDGVELVSFDVARTIVKATTYTVVFTLVATALTSLIRQQAAALVLMFLWPLAIEDILTVVVSLVPGLDAVESWTRFLPYNAGGYMLNVRDVTTSLFGDPLTPWAGFIVFAGFAAVLMVGSFVLFRKRDA